MHELKSPLARSPGLTTSICASVNYFTPRCVELIRVLKPNVLGLPSCSVSVSRAKACPSTDPGPVPMPRIIESFRCTYIYLGAFSCLFQLEHSIETVYRNCPCPGYFHSSHKMASVKKKTRSTGMFLKLSLKSPFMLGNRPHHLVRNA